MSAQTVLTSNALRIARTLALSADVVWEHHVVCHIGNRQPLAARRYVNQKILPTCSITAPRCVNRPRYRFRTMSITLNTPLSSTRNHQPLRRTAEDVVFRFRPVVLFRLLDLHGRRTLSDGSPCRRCEQGISRTRFPASRRSDFPLPCSTCLLSSRAPCAPCRKRQPPRRPLPGIRPASRPTAPLARPFSPLFFLRHQINSVF